MSTTETTTEMLSEIEDQLIPDERPQGVVIAQEPTAFDLLKADRDRLNRLAEQLRSQLVERDLVAADLRAWIERLRIQNDSMITESVKLFGHLEQSRSEVARLKPLAEQLRRLERKIEVNAEGIRDALKDAVLDGKTTIDLDPGLDPEFVRVEIRNEDGLPTGARIAKGRLVYTFERDEVMG